MLSVNQLLELLEHLLKIFSFSYKQLADLIMHWTNATDLYRALESWLTGVGQNQKLMEITKTNSHKLLL